MFKNSLKRFAAASAVLLTCSAGATAEPTKWMLPRCVKGAGPVTLQIVTQGHARWQVNGVMAHGLHHNPPTWVQVPLAQWIGPANGGINAPPQTYTYIVPFSAPGSHGAMSVSATWSADNCGVSLQAGSGTPVPTGACYQGDQDYLVMHDISADFAAADSVNHHLSLTFVTTNEGGPTGLTGVFNIKAECP